MHRPALQRLIRDFTDGRVDAVVTYKIDRVSRSLKDFYNFWELLQKQGHKVTFASATQQSRCVHFRGHADAQHSAELCAV